MSMLKFIETMDPKYKLIGAAILIVPLILNQTAGLIKTIHESSSGGTASTSDMQAMILLGTRHAEALQEIKDYTRQQTDLMKKWIEEDQKLQKSIDAGFDATATKKRLEEFEEHMERLHKGSGDRRDR